MRVVAILNQKGGVGKTTTAVNLGAALALAGKRVLLIDADPQGNLTDHLGLDEQVGEVSVYDVLTDGASVEGAVLETDTPGLWVLPADGDLAAVEQELATEIARETRLRRALEALPADRFDWVLIDCPPSLGLLSLNAMTAATGLLVTVQTEYFAMRGLGQLDEIVQMVQQHVNPSLRILGILPTLVNPVTRLAREVIDEIRGHYGDLVFSTRIRQNVRLAEAPGHQVHIFAYDPLSAGAEDYRALATELEARVAAPQAPAPDVEAATPPDAGTGPGAAGAQDAPAEGPPRPPPAEHHGHEEPIVTSVTLGPGAAADAPADALHVARGHAAALTPEQVERLVREHGGEPEDAPTAPTGEAPVEPDAAAAADGAGEPTGEAPADETAAEETAADGSPADETASDEGPAAAEPTPSEEAGAKRE